MENMKSKRALFLAEETLKIVLAVIVIGFLIYFLASLYFANKDGEELRFAESSVGYIIEQMNSQTTELQIFNPEGWIITVWKTGGEMPSACLDLGWKDCICICEEGTATSCDTDGFCKSYSKEIFIKDGSIKIDNAPITLELNYGDKIEVNKK